MPPAAGSGPAGLCLAEVLVATALLGLLLSMTLSASRAVTRLLGLAGGAKGHTSTMVSLVERIERPLREARQVLEPAEGKTSSRLVFVGFSGERVTWEVQEGHLVSRSEGLGAPRFQDLGMVDRAVFSPRPPPTRSVRYGLVVAGIPLLGSVRPENLASTGQDIRPPPPEGVSP